MPSADQYQPRIEQPESFEGHRALFLVTQFLEPYQCVVNFPRVRVPRSELSRCVGPVPISTNRVEDVISLRLRECAPSRCNFAIPTKIGSTIGVVVLLARVQGSINNRGKESLVSGRSKGFPRRKTSGIVVASGDFGEFVHVTHAASPDTQLSSMSEMARALACGSLTPCKIIWRD